MHKHLHLRGCIFGHFRSDWPFWFWLVSFSFSWFCKPTFHQQYLTFHYRTYSCCLTVNVGGVFMHGKLNSVTRQCSFLSKGKNKVELPVLIPWGHIRGVEVLLHSFITLVVNGHEWSASHPGREPWHPLERTLVSFGENPGIFCREP